MATHPPTIQTSRRVPVDWALLAIPVLALVAVWPLLTQSLPSTDDGALHMLRLVQFDRCLRHGVVCLRWAPDFAHGYGYPGFNYYMNMPTLVAELWHLVGLDYPQAMAAAFIAAWFLSGWGAYLLGRDIVGTKAGLVVATAYMYAPYQFYDSMYRGNLPEMWALALIPWVLWTGRYAATHRPWRAILPFVLAYAALIWTHNIYAMVGSAILGLYLLVLWWQNGHSWREAWRLGTMVCLGLSLAAFFWIPALFEQGWTRYSPGLFDYTRAFLPLQEMLSWPPQLDLSLLNPYPPRSLSWGMLILLALGVVACLRRPQASRQGRSSSAPSNAEWTFYVGVFLLMAFLPLPAAASVWTALKPLQLVQYPWRLLGLTSLSGSLCAGWAVLLLPDPTRRSLRVLGTCIALLLLIATAIPWTYAAPFPQPKNAGVDNILRWEYSTGLVGGTSTNEFLPVWASGVPDDPADAALLTEHDPIIARLDESTLPAGATILSADYGVMRAEIVVETPQPFRARYKQFYYPGWQVTIDGESVPLIVTAPYGLLGFDVPAGELRIVVRPTSTPLRTLGNAIAVLSVLAVIGIAVVDRASRTAYAKPASPERQGWTWLPVILLALLVLVIKEGLIDRTENLFRARHFDGARLRGVQFESQINFGNTFTLLGYDLPRRPVTSGDPMRVDLYLSARQAVDGDYLAYARLVDDEGRLWSLRDNGRPEGFRPPPPTQAWPTDAYGHWAYLAYTLAGTPPGEYWIEVAVFERDSWRGLNVVGERGQIVSLTSQIGPVQIVPPRTPPAIETLDMDRPLEAEVSPALRCIGSAQSTRSAQVGDILEITLFWQAAQDPAADYALAISLASPDGTYPLADDLPLGRRTYPTSAWKAGDIVRSPHHLRIPVGVPAGTYAIAGTVHNRAGSAVAPSFELGRLEILPTDRLFEVPADLQHPLGANLADQVMLLGYDLAPSGSAPGSSLSVTLYWQGTREMATSYKVFVQVVGSDGVLAQVDATPVGWGRPTTGWVAGEILVDPYDLAIPQDAPVGTYALIAGLYDEETLVRLNVLDTTGNPVRDHVVLQEIAVR